MGGDSGPAGDQGARTVAPEVVSAGAAVAVLRWALDPPQLVVSSAPVGGGIGIRHWILNAQVDDSYARTDLDAHVEELAAELGCRGDGVGMLTAKDVTRVQHGSDEGVHCAATVGVRDPTWAADRDAVATGLATAGTINVVAFLPVRLADAALVNAVVTVTEAKTQALARGGVPGTGTASDAVCICCPADGTEERFGGPRSQWGSRLARATYAAVAAGLGDGAP